jgi:heptosyltransferase-2
VAVIQFGGIGDMVLITAALRELSVFYPNAGISVICSRKNHADFLSNLPFVEDVVPFDIYALDVRQVFRKEFWRRLLTLAGYLRSARFDVLVNFHHPFLIDWFLMEFILVALSRARFSVGANPAYLPERSVYHRWIGEGVLEGLHYKDFFLEIIRLLGARPSNLQTEFPLAPEDVIFAQDFLSGPSGQSAGLAVIHPGSSAPHNHWPVGRYAELSKELTRRGLRVLVVGSESDRAAGAVIRGTNPQAEDLTGQTTLARTAALIARADIFIGNDSSQFHVAVALNTPAVGIIGGGDFRFHGYSRENIRVVKREVDCAPCRERTCPKRECLKKIRVDEVLDAVQELAPAGRLRPLGAEAAA